MSANGSELVNWITDQEWDHWCSLTFEHPIGIEGACKSRDLWVRWLERRGTGRIAWVSGMEYGPGADRPHFHIVTWNTARLGVAVIKSEWRFGRAEVEPYDPSLGGVAYMLKKLGSENMEWDISIPRRPPKKLSPPGQLVIF